MPPPPPSTTGSATANPTKRVEGWTNFYEYFHMLDADMQVSAQWETPSFPPAGLPARLPGRARGTISDVMLRPSAQRTNELSAQRRACPNSLIDTLPSLKAVPVSSAPKEIRCFDNIASAIKNNDKPYVKIEDDGNGAAVRPPIRPAPHLALFSIERVSSRPRRLGAARARTPI